MPTIPVAVKIDTLAIIAVMAVSPPAWADCARFVSYAPTHFDPTVGQFPDDANIAADLRVLRNEGFSGLITYAADGTLNRIPRLAKQLGFTCVYMGLFCPTRAEEIAAAVAESSWVDAYVIGNEGLGDARMFCPYDTLELAAAMSSVRSTTGKWVTTSEQVDDYLSSAYAPWLLAHCDLVLPNAHPFWAKLREPIAAVQWTVGKATALKSQTTKPVLLKETGLPSDGCPECSAGAQRTFYQVLLGSGVAFSYFEAFDQPWRTAPSVEPHWGINDASRTPKLTGQWLPAHASSWGQVKRRYR
jgi:exo-beta-1,3-glucanase (GH17 family)